jgi:hypothetical protein
MRTLICVLAAAFALGAATPTLAAPGHKHHRHHKAKTHKHHVTRTSSSSSSSRMHGNPPAHPKNEVTKIEKDRQEDHTVRQVTPDPKKSPAKHADNLSKNVNHELNRESKDINHVFQGKKK